MRWRASTLGTLSTRQVPSSATGRATPKQLCHAASGTRVRSTPTQEFHSRSSETTRVYASPAEFPSTAPSTDVEKRRRGTAVRCCGCELFGNCGEVEDSPSEGRAPEGLRTVASAPRAYTRGRAAHFDLPSPPASGAMK